MYKSQYNNQNIEFNIEPITSAVEESKYVVSKSDFSLNNNNTTININFNPNITDRLTKNKAIFTEMITQLYLINNPKVKKSIPKDKLAKIERKLTNAKVLSKLYKYLSKDQSELFAHLLYQEITNRYTATSKELQTATSQSSTTPETSITPTQPLTSTDEPRSYFDDYIDAEMDYTFLFDANHQTSIFSNIFIRDIIAKNPINNKKPTEDNTSKNSTILDKYIQEQGFYNSPTRTVTFPILQFNSTKQKSNSQVSTFITNNVIKNIDNLTSLTQSIIEEPLDLNSFNKIQTLIAGTNAKKFSEIKILDSIIPEDVLSLYHIENITNENQEITGKKLIININSNLLSQSKNPEINYINILISEISSSLYRLNKIQTKQQKLNGITRTSKNFVKKIIRDNTVNIIVHKVVLSEDYLNFLLEGNNKSKAEYVSNFLYNSLSIKDVEKKQLNILSSKDLINSYLDSIDINDYRLTVNKDDLSHLIKTHYYLVKERNNINDIITSELDFIKFLLQKDNTVFKDMILNSLNSQNFNLSNSEIEYLKQLSKSNYLLSDYKKQILLKSILLNKTLTTNNIQELNFLIDQNKDISKKYDIATILTQDLNDKEILNLTEVQINRITSFIIEVVAKNSNSYKNFKTSLSENKVEDVQEQIKNLLSSQSINNLSRNIDELEKAISTKNMPISKDLLRELFVYELSQDSKEAIDDSLQLKKDSYTKAKQKLDKEISILNENTSISLLKNDLDTISKKLHSLQENNKTSTKMITILKVSEEKNKNNKNYSLKIKEKEQFIQTNNQKIEELINKRDKLNEKISLKEQIEVENKGLSLITILDMKTKESNLLTVAIALVDKKINDMDYFKSAFYLSSAVTSYNQLISIIKNSKNLTKDDIDLINSKLLMLRSILDNTESIDSKKNYIKLFSNTIDSLYKKSFQIELDETLKQTIINQDNELLQQNQNNI